MRRLHNLNNHIYNYNDILMPIMTLFIIVLVCAIMLAVTHTCMMSTQSQCEHCLYDNEETWAPPGDGARVGARHPGK